MYRFFESKYQNKQYMNRKNRKSGFTLLELLIVIAIIAILAVALIVVLNPAETLKKSRDVQRISDMNTLKTALGLYTTSVSPVYLGGAASNASCQVGATWVGEEGTGLIYYSLDATTGNITDTTLDATTFTSTGNAQAATVAANGLTDGTGWLPVNFDAIGGGSPISNLPIDPTNTVTVLTAVANTDLVYRYACNSALTYEIDAPLESTAYTSTDNKMAKDGGNNTSYYEVGTSLKILGTGTDF